MIPAWFLYWVYSFPEAAVTKYHELSGFRQQTLVFPQFWRLVLQSRDVGGVTLPLRVPGENPSFPLPASGGPQHPLACNYITPVSASIFMWTSFLCLPSSSYKDTSHWI